MENLTLVIPAKKESESLPGVLDELKNYSFKILIILEKSDIETIESLRNYDAKIHYQNAKGYGNAIIDGINNTNTELFCIFNADGSFDPSELNRFVKLLRENNKDFVYASRYLKNGGSEDDTFLTYIGNKFFTLIGRIFFNLPITDILYTFVVGKTEMAKNLNLKQQNFTFCVELPIKVKRKGLNMVSASSYERKRSAGKKKVNEFKDGMLILFHLITMFFKR